MVTEEIKIYALRLLLTEHLWEEGDADNFIFNNRDYRIEKVENGFLYRTYNLLNNEWNKGKLFPTMGRLFNYFFKVNFIAI